MNKFMFNVKQVKMNKFIKYIWQLIISTSNATLEVPLLRPCFLRFYHIKYSFSNMSWFSEWVSHSENQLIFLHLFALETT